MDKDEEAGVIITQPTLPSHFTPKVAFETVTIMTPQVAFETVNNITQTQYLIPVPIPGVPPGLELLHSAQEIILDCKSKGLKKMDYGILDKQGYRLYKASVDCHLKDDCCHCVGPCFTASIFNHLGELVIKSKGSPQNFNEKIDVQNYGYCKILNTGFYYKMADVNGNVVVIKKGRSFCCCSCYKGNGDFKVFQSAASDSSEKTKNDCEKCLVGKIHAGVDKLTILFPNGLDARMKAVILGSWLVIATDHSILQQLSDFDRFCRDWTCTCCRK